VVVASACLCLVATGGAPASAHAELADSSPGNGVTVEQPPAELVLRLTQPVESSATTVSVVDGDGHAMSVGQVTLTKDPIALRVALPPLPANTYRVSWSTLSSDDLHPTAGVLVFGVRKPVAALDVAPPAEPLPGKAETVAQWTVYLGFGGWAGAVALLVLLGSSPGTARPEPLRRTRRRLVRLAVAGAAVGLCGSVAVLLIRFSGFPAAVALSTPWVAREVAGVVALVLTPVLRRSRLLVFVPVALTIAAGTGLTGHFAGAGPLLLTIATTHVLAMMLWAGSVVAAAVALVPLRRSPERRLARVVLRRFAVLAASSVAVLVSSGLVLTGQRVASLDALLLSTYGRALLVKIALVSLACVIGLLSTSALHRRLGRLPSSTRLRRLVTAEAIALGAVLVLTAVLASAHSADGRLWRAAPAQTQDTSATVEDLVETVGLSPNIPGHNFVAVHVFDTRRPAPAPITAVLVALRGPDGTTAARPATAGEGGAYVLATDVVTTAGRWDVEVTVHRAGAPPVTATFARTVDEPVSVLRPVFVSAAPLGTALNWLALVVLLLAGLGGTITALAVRGRRRRPVETVRVEVPELVSTRR
jgi:copper transport protein